MQESGRGDLGSGRPTFDPSNARFAHACRTPDGVVAYFGSSDGDKAIRHLSGVGIQQCVGIQQSDAGRISRPHGREGVRRPNHTSVDYSMRRLIVERDTAVARMRRLESELLELRIKFKQVASDLCSLTHESADRLTCAVTFIGCPAATADAWCLVHASQTVSFNLTQTKVSSLPPLRQSTGGLLVANVSSRTLHACRPGVTSTSTPPSTTCQEDDFV